MNYMRGFSLIETIVGVALMLVVFVSILGVAQMGIKLISQAGAMITATALANQKIELARNLPYDEVGTIGGIPNGSIQETETIIRNKITFTVKTTIVYIDDSFDNLFPADPLPADYKRVKVRVSWSGLLGQPVFLQTDVAPKGIETTGGGGIISVLVFDANGQPISQADTQIENNSVSPPINVHYQTNDQGRLFIPGSPACNDCYKITASKTGYSSERTYAVGEVVRGEILTAPLKPFVSVLENQMSEISFAIDRVSTKNIETIKYIEEKTWSDSFEDESKISEKFQVMASTTLLAMALEEQAGQYFSSGYFLTATITPTALVEWDSFSWDDETPLSTEIKYRVLYFTAGNWVLIPDDDLTIGGVENSEGFSVSSVDLSVLDPDKYSQLKIKASFSTTDVILTPVLFDLQVIWLSTDTSTPIPNVSFIMEGTKILGTDANGNPIYKYENNFSTDNNGQVTISNLEWDSYRISINGLITGYDIANSLPPQPVNINPATSQTTVLKLANHQNYTLLVTVKDSAGQPLAGASARLYKTGYDKTKLTSSSGQAFFSPLSAAFYNLEIEMSGYQDWLGEIEIRGQDEQIITLTPP